MYREYTCHVIPMLLPLHIMPLKIQHRLMLKEEYPEGALERVTYTIPKIVSNIAIVGECFPFVL